MKGECFQWGPCPSIISCPSLAPQGGGQHVLLLKSGRTCMCKPSSLRIPSDQHTDTVPNGMRGMELSSKLKWGIPPFPKWAFLQEAELVGAPGGGWGRGCLHARGVVGRPRDLPAWVPTFGLAMRGALEALCSSLRAHDAGAEPCCPPRGPPWRAPLPGCGFSLSPAQTCEGCPCLL